MKKSENIYVTLWNKSAAFREVVIIVVFTILLLIIALSFDISDSLIEILNSFQSYNLNEIFIVSIFLAVASSIFAYRRWQDYKSEVQERKNAE